LRKKKNKNIKEIEIFTFKTERKDVKFVEIEKKKSLKLNKPPKNVMTKEEDDFLAKEDPEYLKKNMRKVKGAREKVKKNILI